MSKNILDGFIPPDTAGRESVLTGYIPSQEAQKEIDMRLILRRMQTAENRTLSQQPTEPPQVAGDNPYMNSEHFQRILTDAKTNGLDALTDEERQQVKEAKNNFPEVAAYLRDSDKKAEDISSYAKMIDIGQTMNDLETRVATAMAKNVGGPFHKQYGAALNEFRKGITEAINKYGQTGVKIGDKSISQMLTETFEKMELEPKEAIKIPYFDEESGKLKSRPMATRELLRYNLAVGGLRIAPELLASFIDNPAGFYWGIANFPLEELGIIHTAADLPGEELIRQPYTDEEIENAREELINNPIGPVMLGMMMFGAGKGMSKMAKKSKTITVPHDYLEGISRGFDKAIFEKVKVEAKAADERVAQFKKEDQLKAEFAKKERAAETRQKAAIMAREHKIKQVVTEGKEVPEVVLREFEGADWANKALQQKGLKLKEIPKPKEVKKPGEKLEKKPSVISEKKVAEPKGEPITAEELQRAETDVSRLKDDIATKEKLLTELEPVITRGKDVQAQVLAQELKKQAAKSKFELDKAEKKLRDYKKRPIVETEPEPKPPAPAAAVSAGERKGAPPTKETPKEKGAEKTAESVSGETDPVRVSEQFSEEMEKALDKQFEEPKPPTPIAKEVFKVKPSDIKTDTKRFQKRQDAFAKESVERITSAYEPTKFDPIIAWKDPKSGESIILSGHSRYEASNKLGLKEVPVKYFEGTEAEAVKFARESNLGATEYNLAEKVRVFEEMKKEGANNKELKKYFGDRTNKIDAYTNLDPGGKFMEILNQEARSSFPYIEQKARDIGEIRKDFKELTNRHEDQMFDALYGETTKLREMPKEDFRALVENQVTDALWTPDQPLLFKRGQEVVAGARARKDTGAIMKRINEINDRIKKAETVQEVEALQSKKKKLEDGIRDMVKNQGEMEFGFLGTPGDFLRMVETVYNTTKSVSDFAKDMVDRGQYTPEMVRGVKDALEIMRDHHREIRDSDVLSHLLTTKFEKAIPDKSRWRPITHAVQQGKESMWWQELTPFEQGIAEWLRVESKRLEDFVRNREIMEVPERTETGSRYLMQWVKDPKTNKPYPAHYGKFARTAIPFKKKKYPTLEALEDAGFEPVTYNPGKLLGESWRAVQRVYQTQQMVKNLNLVEAPIDLSVAIKGGERPSFMIESMETIRENGLGTVYKKLKDDRNLLAKDIYLKNGRIKTTDVGVLEELHPYVQAYLDNPTYGKLARINFIAKGMKLFGLFHPAVLFKKSMTLGRNPFMDMYRGKKIIDEFGPNMQLYMRNGLNISGFEDIGFNTASAMTFEGKNLLSKTADVAFAPMRFVQRQIFEKVHPRLKICYVDWAFNREWPRLQAEGYTKDQAAREIIRQADQFFSGEDYKMALLESSRFAAKWYYAADWRKGWQMTYLSPTWQMQHIREFTSTSQSLAPKSMQIKMKEITPGNFVAMREMQGKPIANLYRRFLAGSLLMYSAYNMVNYTTTHYMDGEGKFTWQNEEGKKLRVRAPWNDDDNRPVYFHPLKSMMEIPETAHSFFVGDWGKLVAKLHPMLSSTMKQMLNIGEYNRIQYDRYNKPNLAKRIIDWNIDVWTPITIDNLIGSSNYITEFLGGDLKHRATIGAIVSALAFPVSRGYPGGEWNKKLDDFKIQQKGDDKEKMKGIDNAIIDGNIIGALMAMHELGKGRDAMAGRLLRHKDRLLYNWMNMSDPQKYMFLQSLPENDRDKFLIKVYRTEKETE